MKKKAEDLKPGDVLPANAAYGRRVVCAVSQSEQWEDRLAIRVFSVDSGSLDTRIDCLDSELEVESPALTPAQQHAEELVGLMRAVGEGLDRRCEIHQLLARIDPPKPPSAEELVEALSSLRSAVYVDAGHTNIINGADKLLERARQAGMLKDPQ